MNSIFDDQKPVPEEGRKESFTSLGLGSDGVEARGRKDYAPPDVPESFAETVRMSGLAYASVLTLVASVVFMLLIGWFVDLLAGSSPIGVVGGIIIGAAIGFFQFFKMAGRIFRK